MIVVTGGAGYIGSHCVLALHNSGYKVKIFDNLSTGHAETIDRLSKCADVEFVKGDLNNPEDLDRLFSGEKVSAVIHFAAFSQVGESMTEPAKYYRNNVCGTLNLLDKMLQYGVGRIVFSSTAATYGEPEYTPIDEKHPQRPINTYGRTKLMIENIMDDYDHAYGLKSVRLRYFNVAGADSDGRVGEWHDPETHLVPNILKSTFTGGKTFQMFGTDYETRDGTCVRDYINVEDLARAHILALKYLENGGKTEYFNLGTGEGSTVREVFSACEKITGKSIAVDEKPRRAGDPSVLIADASKVRNILGWIPQKDLEQSVSSAYSWEKTLQSMLQKK